MKVFFTHFLTFLFGVLLVLIYLQEVPQDKILELNRTISSSSEYNKDVAFASPSTAKEYTETERVELSGGVKTQKDVLTEPISSSKLDQWLQESNDNHKLRAERLVIVGLLSGNTDMIRKGIEADPQNPHLLFIGATDTAFTPQERLRRSEELFRLDSDNAMSGYVYAASLLEMGDFATAVEVLATSSNRTNFEDFLDWKMLLTEEAYIDAGFSIRDSKIASALNTTIPYLTPLLTCAESLKRFADSSNGKDAVSLRSDLALMGKRIGDSSKNTPLVSRLIGLTIEMITLDGLDENANSPYQGMTISEARQSIVKEREEITDLVSDGPDLERLVVSNPTLSYLYLERTRSEGELSALKWLRERGLTYPRFSDRTK